MPRQLKIFISLAILFSFSFAGEKQKVLVFPGVGIAINNDTIYIEKTSPKQLSKTLKIKEQFGTSDRIWDGYNPETGESVSGSEMVKNIIYKGIDFEFTGKIRDSLTLKWIKIKVNKNFNVYINDSLYLGQINPPLDRYFKKNNKYDYISDSRMTYNLYSVGISFQLDSLKMKRCLNEVSVHYTIKSK
ncbi:hypothetical protein [Telluribacter sp.]|jgi:hypothetical protein|uniref:hypothetical protein n=1 Tax=Telluribacter sp. TaxID=1978767 RepID=UPI002E1192B6|nr:hypothetical protein [Telluribacter sp.]